jgi:hypothetical protein
MLPPRVADRVHRRPRGLLAGAVLLGALALAGCSGDDASDGGDATAPTSAEGGAAEAPATTGAPTTTVDPSPRPDAADELFVTLDGSDDHAGTDPARPLRTVEAALAVAGPGDTVLIGAGTWPRLTVRDLAGAPDAPITLRPAPGAEGEVWFSHGDRAAEFGLWIERSQWLVLDGIGARDSLWGIRILASSGITVRNSVITDTGQEALAVKDGSTDIVIERNLIQRTGLVLSQFGEAVYLGTGGETSDGTARIVVRDNELADLTAEAIDVKAFVTDVVIERNLIHDVATANSGAVVVGIGERVYPDPNVVIRDNRIWNVTTTSPYSDGNAISLSAPATVVNNVIWNVQHRGILADGNFVNPDARTVRIFHNSVWNWGIAAIEVWESDTPADPDIRCNVGPDLPGNLAATAELYVDAGGGDLRLQPGAAGIDACASPGLVEVDIEGTPRDAAPDMGAYERTAAARG